ncbi:MAG: hypothetical protein AB1599_02855 [Planctomycetota bacterium]
MSKDKPELYELLKSNKSKLGKLPSQEKDEQATSATVTAASDSESSQDRPIPFTAPSSSGLKPYPKLKIPFPTLKPKEPTGVFQKPKPVRQKIMDEKIPLNYTKIIVIGGIVAAIAVIIYLLWSLPPGKAPAGSRTTPPSSAQQPETPPAPPAATGRTWSIRLIYYKNNTEGQNLVQSRLKFLNDKGVSGVFTKNEKIESASCTSIYKGKYASLEEAKKDLPKLKQLHYAFKNADAVEVK